MSVEEGGQQPTRWWAEHAWLGEGPAASSEVLVETAGGFITRVEVGARRPDDAVDLPGLVLPGLVNAHSHAFHRALRGRTEAGDGDFWTWRQEMYAAAAALDPESLFALARATYAEMALAGISTVGEFHYLHHAPDGTRYEPAYAMADALALAADEAGLRLTLLDTCYLRGGFDEPLNDVQHRFSDGSAESWAERASSWDPPAHVLHGAAIHSVRAVDLDAMRVVRDWAAARDAPLHVHVSEQPAENEACRAATGRSPTGLLHEAEALGERTTVVHATHVDQDDATILAATGTGVCVCPTTERALADGIGPAAALRALGNRLCLGSDSHATIDLFEEARGLEHGERLASGERGRHQPEHLLSDATYGGAVALGWATGWIAEGQLADLVAVDVASVRTAGFDPSLAAAFAVFAATAADVTDVVVGGRRVVEARRHLRIDEPAADLAGVIRRLLEP